MPLIETKGAASAQGFGLNIQQAAATYIEDVFSTYLYTGDSSNRSITNGIDLSTKGGMVWGKQRSTGNTNHGLFDTVRGPSDSLSSNSTDASYYAAGTEVTGFNLNGFSLGATGFNINLNTAGNTYVSWTFRKQPKFFDVVTYTGTGASSQTISHSLASVPGFIAIKRTDSTGDWVVIARSSSNGQYYCLQNATTPFGFNSTNAAYGTVDFAGMGYLSSTTFLPYVFGGGNSSSSGTNISGATYVAYLFAHNAGGFGLTGTDNVISCGSFTTDGSGNASVTLGYEPQWLLVKSASGTSNWWLADNMRGMTASNQTNYLSANTPNPEGGPSALYGPTATGFNASAQNASQTYIYIAIRRGPMRVPRDATTVFTPVAWTGTGSVKNMSTGSLTVPDLFYSLDRTGTFNDWYFVDRLRGNSKGLRTPATTAEGTFSASVAPGLDVMNNITLPTSQVFNNAGTGYANYAFGRAPGFFDEVCYTGTGSAPTLNHNLAVAPELIINRSRATGSWFVYQPSASANYGLLNTTDAFTGPASVSATSTTYVPISYANGVNFVSYLFASCPGVSKVGTYTGNGTTQTINCGFAGGARFVLIKRTDSTGDWYVYDTARGMTTLTDPYSFTNSTAPETATLGSVTTVATGFAVNAAVLAAINTNAATYIFLAIA